MAQRVTNGSAASGTWTTASLWDTVVNTPTIHATTSLTLSNTNLFSATFTAPNTTNKSTGVLIFMNSQPSRGLNWTATLQQSSVDTAATSTIATNLLNDGVTSNNAYWVYFQWGTPFTFTTTAAGAYRIKLVASSSSSATLGADTGGANFAYITCMDSNVAPASTDDAIVAAPNVSGTVSITIPTGTTFGSGADGALALPTAGRSANSALMIGAGGVVIPDLSANFAMTVKGNMIIGGNQSSSFTLGTQGTPVPSSQTATITMNQNGTTGNYGIIIPTGSQAVFSMVGASKTFNKTKYVSGNGTTATPLVTADTTGWAVNDELVFTATSSNATNYLEWERLFIKTISGTSITLSATAGGVESGLVNTHNTNCRIYNVNRNVTVTGLVTNVGPYYVNGAQLPNIPIIQWTRWEYVGNNLAGAQRTAVMFEATGNGKSIADYNVSYATQYRGLTWQTSTQPQTYTGNISYAGTPGQTVGGMIVNVALNKTLVDHAIIGCNRGGLELIGATNCTFTGLVSNGNNSINTVYAGMVFFNTSAQNTFTNAEVNCNRTRGISFNGTLGNTFVTSQIGTYGTNVIDVDNTTGQLNTSLFDTCSFGSATLINNYTNITTGSQITFKDANGTAYNDSWYTPNGVAQATGAGLTDTNIRTSSTYNIRILGQTTTTGFTYSYYKVVPVGQAISALGFVQLNAAFTGDAGATCVVNLYLPGNQATGATPDATYTLPKTTNSYQPYVLAANYLGTIPGLTRIDIVVKTTTALAYAYVADLDNGSNPLTNFTIWLNGLPSTLMPETLGDAVAIWATATSALTASGSIGAYLSDALTETDFMGLK